MNIQNPEIQKRAIEKGQRYHLNRKKHGSKDLVIRISRIVMLTKEVIYQNCAKMKLDYFLLILKGSTASSIPSHRRPRF